MVINDNLLQPGEITVNFLIQRRRFGIKQCRRFGGTRFHADFVISIAEFFHFRGNFFKRNLNRRRAQNPPFLPGSVLQDLIFIFGKFIFVFYAGRSFYRQTVRTVNDIVADKLNGTDDPGSLFGAFFLRNLNDNALPFGIVDFFHSEFLGIQKSITPVININKKTDFIMSQFDFAGYFAEIDIAFGG